MNTPNLGWLTWLAMLLVLAAAAVLSFAALRDLAELCGVAPPLAWLLPISVDAGAAVSTRIWLSGRAVLAERYSRNMTWSLLFATVAGNALHSGLIAADTRPAWWVAVLVGAVPPAIVGAVVHLAVLVGRPAGGELSPTPSRFSAPGSVEIGQVVDGDHQNQAVPGGSPTDLERTDLDDVGNVDDGHAPDRLAALIAEGAGRRRVARELGVTEYQARELLASRNGGGPHE